MLNHNDTGNMRQTSSVIESDGVTDFISITDRIVSMSFITQERAKIAADVPELFHLKIFICSNSELTCTGKAATYRNMLISQKY